MTQGKWIRTKEFKEKLSKIHKENGNGKWMKGRKREKIGTWKGDNVGYSGLHKWVAENKPKSLFCEMCGKLTHKLECSSNEHTYERDISKWRWLCHKCHHIYDQKINVNSKRYDKEKGI